MTVWEDGRVTVNGRGDFRISREDAERFRSILLPFRPAGDLAGIDPSTVMPDTCPVKIRWSDNGRGAPGISCGDYSTGTLKNPLFEAVVRAFESIHLGAEAQPTP